MATCLNVKNVKKVLAAKLKQNKQLHGEAFNFGPEYWIYMEVG